jgi:TolA-binding protein
MKRPDCLSDLVTRSRRYRMSRDEQAELDAHLPTCASCRLTQQIGADFDAIGGLQARDGVLIATLAKQIAQRGQRKSAGRTMARFVAVAAAVALALFAAAAGAYAVFERRATESVAATAGPWLATAPEPEQVDLVANAASRGPRVDAPNPVRQARPSSHAMSRARAERAPARSASVESASSLFASANGERRASHVVEAISLYDELERRYPESPEAHVSRVSLGRLLLARSMWADALTQLNDYLTASPDGTLAPEALFGMARSLEALGRTGDARATWGRLLAKFPDSVYAAQAQRRIEDFR